MIWGNDLSNIGFIGSGTIDGNGHLVSGTPQTGQADKIISLTRCSGLTVSGITLKNGGHFAMLIDDCDHVTSNHLTISTAGTGTAGTSSTRGMSRSLTSTCHPTTTRWCSRVTGPWARRSTAGTSRWTTPRCRPSAATR
jgi:hypothetical protein